MNQLVLYRNHSMESEQTEQLLKDKKVKHITFLSDSEEGKPTLYVSGKTSPYEGYGEIAQFILLFLNILMKSR